MNPSLGAVQGRKKNAIDSTAAAQEAFTPVLSGRHRPELRMAAVNGCPCSINRVQYIAGVSTVAILTRAATAFPNW